MKNIRNSVACAATLLLLGCGGNGAAADANTKDSKSGLSRNPEIGLCKKEEKVIFNCTIKSSRKIVSVCSSLDLDKPDSYMMYRFGKPEKVELEFPDSKINSFEKFYYSVYIRPKVTRQALRFNNRDYEYIIEVDNEAEEEPGTYGATISIDGPKKFGLTCDTAGLVGIDVNIGNKVRCDPDGMWAEFSCPH